MDKEKKSPEAERAQKEVERIHQIVQDITNMAAYLKTSDMQLAGMVYLASIVRRRKYNLFMKPKISKGSGS